MTSNPRKNYSDGSFDCRRLITDHSDIAENRKIVGHRQYFSAKRAVLPFSSGKFIFLSTGVSLHFTVHRERRETALQ
jgi:hypothetical protein